MDNATPLPEHQISPGLGHDVPAQVLIWGKNNRLIWGNLAHNLDRIGTGADDVTHGLNFSRAINVRNHQMVRMGSLKGSECSGGGNCQPGNTLPLDPVKAPVYQD